MTKAIKIGFLIELQNPMDTAELITKLKLDNSFEIFDEYEITTTGSNYYEIIAYINEFDIDNMDNFENNFNKYKLYINSISNEFSKCMVFYNAVAKNSIIYYLDRGHYEDEIEITCEISFRFNLDEVEDFDSIEFKIDKMKCDSDEIAIPSKGLPIYTTYKNIFTDVNKLIESNSNIYTSHWCYESDGTIILTDCIKIVNNGIYVGDGKDQLVALRDELNTIINQLD